MAAQLGFPFLLAFVVVDYLRPQDWIGPLAGAPIAIIAVIPVALCLLATLRREVILDPVSIAMGSIVAFAAAWVPFATNNFWAFQAFKFLLVAWISMLAIATFVDRPARLRGLLALLLVIFSTQAISALGSGGHGNNSYFGDENDLALGLNVALPFAVIGIRGVRGLAAKAVLVAASGLLVAGVVASSSRGGLVGLAAAMGAIVLMSRRRLAVLLGMLLAVSALAALTPASYWADMNTMFDPADATREERVHQWRSARTIWRDNPWLGVGPGNAPWVMAAYEKYDDLAARSLAGRAVHSLYFTVLPEYGVVGTALFVFLLGGTTLHCAAVIRRRRSASVPDSDPWARAILASGVACLSGGAFISVLLYPHLYYLGALSMAVRSIALRTAAPASAPPRNAWAIPASGAARPTRRRRFGIAIIRCRIRAGTRILTTTLRSADAAASDRSVRGLLRRIALPLLRASERERVLHDWRRRLAGEPVLSASIRSVAFVCKGNLCRSPFAAALLARACPALRVGSYGLDAATGHPAEDAARALAHAYGVDLDAHRTRRLDADAVREFDLLLVMEAWQARAIERSWPATHDRVLLLGDFLPAPPFGIEDPWGQSQAVWRGAYQRIDASIARLARQLGGG